MTHREQIEMDRLRKRVSLLEARNRELVKGQTIRPCRRLHRPTLGKGALDRFAWLVQTIEEACTHSGVRAQIRVSLSDAKLLRPILKALVDPLELRASKS